MSINQPNDSTDRAPEPLRNIFFLLCAMALFGASWAFATYDAFPKLQLIAYKASIVCFGVHLGYWVDRMLYRDRISAESPPARINARAILVTGITLALAIGL